MRRRWKVLLIGVSSAAVVAVVSFLYMFGFPPFYRTVPLTVDQLAISPSSWVGKRVSVEGSISEHIIIMPEFQPPYNCMLSALPPAQAYFGVLWKNPDPNLNYQNVTVVGIVKYGMDRYYYIEAEDVIIANTG
jgi:hypothetical protein